MLFFFGREKKTRCNCPRGSLAIVVVKYSSSSSLCASLPPESYPLKTKRKDQDSPGRMWVCPALCVSLGSVALWTIDLENFFFFFRGEEPAISTTATTTATTCCRCRLPRCFFLVWPHLFLLGSWGGGMKEEIVTGGTVLQLRRKNNK